MGNHKNYGVEVQETVGWHANAITGTESWDTLKKHHCSLDNNPARNPSQYRIEQTPWSATMRSVLWTLRGFSRRVSLDRASPKTEQGSRATLITSVVRQRRYTKVTATCRVCSVTAEYACIIEWRQPEAWVKEEGNVNFLRLDTSLTGTYCYFHFHCHCHFHALPLS